MCKLWKTLLQCILNVSKNKSPRTNQYTLNTPRATTQADMYNAFISCITDLKIDKCTWSTNVNVVNSIDNILWLGLLIIKQNLSQRCNVKFFTLMWHTQTRNMTVLQGTREGNYQYQQLKSNHTVNMWLLTWNKIIWKKKTPQTKERGKKRFHHRTLKAQ